MPPEPRPPAADPSARPELLPILRLGDVVGIVVGSVIGSGIFIVPATVALEVRSPLLIFAVWLAGGFLSFFGALAFAELGSMFPQAGGMYVYLREAYNPLVAFLFGWTLFLVIDSGAVATLAVAFTSKYLPYFVDLSAPMQKVTALAMIVVLLVVNVVGVRWGSILQNLLTIIKSVAIVGVSVAIFVLATGKPTHFTTPPPETLSGDLVSRFGLALIACLWAYKGWEAATFSTGEMRNPKRDLFGGLLIGMLVILVLYLAANAAYLYVFSAEEMARSSRVAADAMNVAMGAGGAALLSFFILFSIAGAANANVLTSPRVYYAMAQDRLFFKPLAAVHPRFRTPHVAILAMGAWSVVLSLSGTFEQLAAYVVFGQWIFFGLTVGAVMILRRKRPELARPVRTWGYPVTPIIFIASALFIALSALVNQFENAMAGLGIIALGIPAYLFWARRRRIAVLPPAPSPRE
ncbi:MAG: amino acid permease [Planctomycetota bacterium]